MAPDIPSFGGVLNQLKQEDHEYENCEGYTEYTKWVYR